MKNLSNVKPEDFLLRCKGGFVENRKMIYKGVEYNIPYSTVTVGGERLEGLRENFKRFELYERLISEHTTGRNSYLDVGCNLGVFVRNFSDMFNSVTGVDYESYYIDQAKFLFEDLSDSFILNDINATPLTSFLSEPFDVITSNSMFEYISDKERFANHLCSLTKEMCIVEGHSEDIHLGHDVKYEKILKEQDWDVTRINETTDVGINAPEHTKNDGRPVWICKK
tara:strand:+ start:5888 stop:6562 length:675 start_codon:yes stop_codon:yes gene_type:complete